MTVLSHPPLLPNPRICSSSRDHHNRAEQSNDSKASVPDPRISVSRPRDDSSNCFAPVHEAPGGETGDFATFRRHGGKIARPAFQRCLQSFYSFAAQRLTARPNPPHRSDKMAAPRAEDKPEAEAKKPQVEELDDDASSEDGELEDGEGIPAGSSTTVVQSRNEKKARKLLEKLHLTKIPGITRVTLRRPKNVRRRLSRGRCPAPTLTPPARSSS
jgi:NAC domain-containing protein